MLVDSLLIRKEQEEGMPDTEEKAVPKLAAAEAVADMAVEAAEAAALPDMLELVAAVVDISGLQP